MESAHACRFLPWDSEFFGCRIARIGSDRLSLGTVPAVMAWCAIHAIDCLYLLSAASDQTTAELAQAQRFQMVDVRLTLARSLLCEGSTQFENGDGVIRKWRLEDLAVLTAIARASHGDTRFYADANFPRSRCDALYETWLLQNCRSDAHQVLIAQCQDRPVGYISFRQAGERQGQIELVAVSAAARGRGFGEQLVRAAMDSLARQGLAEITVVTQQRNTAAQRLYRCAGFDTRKVQVWYHRWFKAPTRIVA